MQVSTSLHCKFASFKTSLISTCMLLASASSMATQFECHASLQLREKQLARRSSHGERVIESLPIDRRSSSYCRHSNANDFKMENGARVGDGEEMTARRNKLRKRKRDRGWARELPRYLGSWFMSSSINYILRKARAFYNEFCCDNYFDDSSTAMRHEFMLADPYFSFPVIPPPVISPLCNYIDQGCAREGGWGEPA